VKRVAQVRFHQRVRQHGVEQFPANAQVLSPEHRQVRLQIVPALLRRCVFEQRAKNLPPTCAFIAREWNGDPPGSSAFDAQGEASGYGRSRGNRHRPHRQADRRLPRKQVHQSLQLLPALHLDVLRRHVGNSARLSVGYLRIGPDRFRASRTNCPVRGGLGDRHRPEATPGLEPIAKQPSADGVELELDEQLLEGVRIGFTHRQFAPLRVQGNIPINGCQMFGEQGLFPVLHQVLPQLALEFPDLLQEVFNAAILSDQFRGSLRADTRNTRDIVGCVTHQSEDIDQLPRLFDAPSPTDVLGPEDFGIASHASRAIQQGGGRDELAKILVGRNHERCETLRLRAQHQSANQVVGFVSVQAQRSDAQCGRDAADVWQGDTQRFGHFLPLRFVFRELLVTAGGSLGVKNHRQMRGLAGVPDVQEGLRETVQGRGVDALRGKDRPLNQGEVSPVDQGHAIQKHQLLRHGATLTRPKQTVTDLLT